MSFAINQSQQISLFDATVNPTDREKLLILKEIFGLTDEEIVNTLPFDIRYQYALHTTSFEEQPLNDRTLGRFRARCNSYEQLTGIDLIHDCIIKLSSSMGTLMKLNTGMRRMDSLMVASNIKKMGRLELLYTCVANLQINEKAGGSGIAGGSVSLHGR